MANFWESFLNSGLRKPDDPGDPSMPYGPPLWPQPEQQRFANMGSYDPRGSEQWFGRQQLEAEPQQTNQPAAIQGPSRPIQIAAIGSPSLLSLPRAPSADDPT